MDIADSPWIVEDIDNILKWGKELSREVTHAFFPQLDITKYKAGAEPERATFDMTGQRNLC
jgi:hypothetical protein